MLFDGIDEYVDCGNDSSLGFLRTDTFSYSCWVNLSALPAGAFYNPILSKYESGKGILFGLFNTDGTVRFSLQNNGSLNGISVSSDTKLTTSTWYHLAVTYDGSVDAGGVTMYINNSTTTLTTDYNNLTSGITNTRVFAIGASPITSRYMNGYIDEVSVWNKELTASDVSQIYNMGSPQNIKDLNFAANLVSYWKMGETGSISNMPDEVGINDGTPTNMESGDITTTVPL